MQRSILAVAIALLCPCSAFAQQAQRPTALREIIPGHYAFSSGTFNSGLIVTSEGVVVLDALNSESVGKAEREAIANTIRQPVRFLVSSTFHNNYSKGNVAYADVWKIGHENYRTTERYAHLAPDAHDKVVQSWARRHDASVTHERRKDGSK